jgi:hypothetical protein
MFRRTVTANPGGAAHFGACQKLGRLAVAEQGATTCQTMAILGHDNIAHARSNWQLTEEQTNRIKYEAHQRRKRQRPTRGQFHGLAIL